MILTALFIITINQVIIIKFYAPTQLLLTSIPILMTKFLFIHFAADGMIATAFLSITAYNIHLIVNQINSKFINALNSKSKSRQIDVFPIVSRFLEEHNYLCDQIKSLSDYWKNLWLMFQLSLFPFTLVLLHQIIFEDIEIQIKMVFVLANIAIYSSIFGTQCFLASISEKVHKMCKILSRIQWTLSSQQIDLRFKLKVLTYFERLSSSRRIGFSIGSLTVVTFPLFAGV